MNKAITRPNDSSAAAAPLTTAYGLPLPAGLTDYEIEWFVRLDQQAVNFGAETVAQYPSLDELRERVKDHEKNGRRWLHGFTAQLLADLERDPRLAAIVPLRESYRGDGGLGAFFVARYRELLARHLDAMEGSR